MRAMTVALAGNPNVGKSTVFNALTGLRQHTGNWAGKTVSTASGSMKTACHDYCIVDLPGTYSLYARSEEEQVARDYLASGEADLVIVVCDATCLQRSLHLVLQCLSLTSNVLVCVNLMDEARRQGIALQLDALAKRLGVPVVGCTARSKKSLKALIEAMDHYVPVDHEPRLETGPRDVAAQAEQLFLDTVIEQQSTRRRGSMIDRFFTGTIPGLIGMLLGLTGLLWITIAGANAVSDLLAALLAPVGNFLDRLLAHAPSWLHGALVDGMWRVLSWVVAVMLPPMAIFFPLFTILEDAGVLPRIAYALDKPFQRCSACGKQALTCCMGLGCNAAGVVGCRIIDSPRERLLAVMTNSLMPCSGRFPILATVTAMFFAGTCGSVSSALMLAGWMMLAFVFTFFVTWLLSRTFLKGQRSAFTLELPPYRMPQFEKVLVRSVLDRTVFVLARAAVVAAPAGIVIWILANVTVGDNSLLTIASSALDPFARRMGLDGVILLAFVLGLPANEIVLPLILMGYLSAASLPELGTMESLHQILTAQGWTTETAVCVSLFTLAHWPCSTTSLSIYRETHSVRWTALAIALPTLLGVVVCCCTHMVFSIIM